jgi:hypothetical protein
LPAHCDTAATQRPAVTQRFDHRRDTAMTIREGSPPPPGVTDRSTAERAARRRGYGQRLKIRTRVTIRVRKAIGDGVNRGDGELVRRHFVGRTDDSAQ